MAVSTDVNSATKELLPPGQPPVETKKKTKKVKKGKSQDKAEKTSKKKRKAAEAAAPATSVEQPKKKKKKSKTEVAHSSSDSEDTTVAGAAPAAAQPHPTASTAVPAEPANPLALDNFRLSAPIKSLLRAKNMDSLFDIQAQTLNFCLDGFDLVGRARTGCGKTLAFVLPIVERLSQGYDGGKRAFGRGPRVIVLAPTRELAKQASCIGYYHMQLCCPAPSSYCPCVTCLQHLHCGTIIFSLPRPLASVLQNLPASLPRCMLIVSFLLTHLTVTCRCMLILNGSAKHTSSARCACMAAAHTSHRKAPCAEEWTL